MLRSAVDAWRALTPRHFLFVLSVGFALGSVQGIGAALWQKPPWWTSYLNCVLPAMSLSVVFMLCIVVAPAMSTARVPRWLPYIAAAALSVVLATPIEFAIGRLLAGASLAAADPSAGTGSVPMHILLWVNFPPTLLLTFLAALGYMEYRDAESRARVLRNAQFERASLARRAHVSRLKAMQARVEPHFLFDTLGCVEQLYEHDPALAERMLDDLIVYLRAALPVLDQGNSTAATEMTLAAAWLNIMKVRMRDSLAYTLTFPPTAQQARMPPMVLLPLVEHAVRPLADPPRRKETIDIAVSVADGRLRIAITSDGAASELGNPVTDQVRDRLRTLYQDSASLTVHLDERHNVHAVVDIPYEDSQTASSQHEQRQRFSAGSRSTP